MWSVSAYQGLGEKEEKRRNELESNVLITTDRTLRTIKGNVQQEQSEQSDEIAAHCRNRRVLYGRVILVPLAVSTLVCSSVALVAAIEILAE